MVATADIRFKRMKREYDTLHDAQDETLGKVDSIEAAILGLNQAVASNHELIMANRELIMANRDLIMANHEMTQRQIAELHNKLDAIMEHQDVPYNKPMGFLKE
ncbi:MAG: hypothetical protein OXE95_06795 [Chloroflexi bacterium]|nr:hypothetical protein [Chloroflexota bacterium]MCY4247267.1 hypothetical protein [Chloroflexota bacterium]